MVENSHITSGSGSTRIKKINKMLQEFSIPLIAGVIIAILWANLSFDSYEHFLDYNLIPGFQFLKHDITFHFLVNDVFMVFFFAIAAVEITFSVLKGGPLNPISKAINPLFGTIGGVVGPISVYFLAAHVLNIDSLLVDHSLKEVYNGWGVPTATDIALAWLVAGLIFGKKHPAISFLLLLAIVDDAIGLVIIAVFYPSAQFPVEPIFLFVTAGAMTVAFLLRKFGVRRMWVYLLFAGIPSWIGLLLTHVHPALALVPIVPFLPATHHKLHHSPPLHEFEHFFKYPIDMGLFFFGIANAGVLFSVINEMTWIILASLIIGKTVGIFIFSFVASKLGFALPENVNYRVLVVVGMIAGIGLTVALFVSGEAFTSPDLQGGAKMGAVFSVVAIVIAMVTAKVVKIKKIN